MNIGGEFERGKPRKLVPDVPSASWIEELNALDEGANGFMLYVAALGEGGNKSAIPRVCSVVSEGIFKTSFSPGKPFRLPSLPLRFRSVRANGLTGGTSGSC